MSSKADDSFTPRSMIQGILENNPDQVEHTVRVTRHHASLLNASRSRSSKKRSSSMSEPSGKKNKPNRSALSASVAETTPRTLITGFLGTQDSEKTLRIEPRVTRTPQSPKSPSGNRRRSRRQSLLQQVTMRSFHRSVNEAPDNPTPRTLIRGIIQEGDDETPVIPVRQRRHSSIYEKQDSMETTVEKSPPKGSQQSVSMLEDSFMGAYSQPSQSERSQRSQLQRSQRLTQQHKTNRTRVPLSPGQFVASIQGNRSRRGATKSQLEDISEMEESKGRIRRSAGKASMTILADVHAEDVLTSEDDAASMVGPSASQEEVQSQDEGQSQEEDQSEEEDQRQEENQGQEEDQSQEEDQRQGEDQSQEEDQRQEEAQSQKEGQSLEEAQGESRGQASNKVEERQSEESEQEEGAEEEVGEKREEEEEGEKSDLSEDYTNSGQRVSPRREQLSEDEAPDEGVTTKGQDETIGVNRQAVSQRVEAIVSAQNISSRSPKPAQTKGNERPATEVEHPANLSNQSLVPPSENEDESDGPEGLPGFNSTFKAHASVASRRTTMDSTRQTTLDTFMGYSAIQTPVLPSGERHAPTPEIPPALIQHTRPTPTGIAVKKSEAQKKKSTFTATTPKGKTAQKGKTTPKGKTAKKKTSVPCLPPGNTSSIFKHFTDERVSKDAMLEVEKAAADYWKTLVDDVGALADHAGRMTVDESDCQLLMSRQRLTSEHQSMYTLIEKYFPLEYQMEIIDVAKAGNEIVP